MATCFLFVALAATCSHAFICGPLVTFLLVKPPRSNLEPKSKATALIGTPDVYESVSGLRLRISPRRLFQRTGHVRHFAPVFTGLGTNPTSRRSTVWERFHEGVLGAQRPAAVAAPRCSRSTSCSASLVNHGNCAVDITQPSRHS